MSAPADPRDPNALPIAHATAKAYLLLTLLIILLAGFVLYVMHARGVFEEKRHFVLLAENSEGVTVGMDMTFSGFAIGRVAKIELGEDGKAHIHVEVPVKDARWLRTSSVFTLERGLVGGAKLRAYTGILDDPPLPEGARREVLIGDATAGIPQLVATMRDLIDNLKRITAADAPLRASLANLQTLTGRMTGKDGSLPGLLGEAGAKRVLEALERSNRLLAQADAKILGREGVLDETQAAVAELRHLLGQARQSLEKVDATLDEARQIAANARVASEDLDVLRAEVEASLRRISQLVEEVNRKWPFARERELKLP
ncbi:MlaD family protein [Sulfuricystis multivorans]|uniref:MlaD family protein n=1 Tax=Sulfuricystis multivorans TaxID=2211108 RepID=UPI000F838A79|nr:MlaD family protein [Sulfuricystis multivorans]